MQANASKMQAKCKQMQATVGFEKKRTQNDAERRRISIAIKRCKRTRKEKASKEQGKSKQGKSKAQ